MDKKKVRNVANKLHIERRKICLLTDEKMRKRFEEKVI